MEEKRHEKEERAELRPILEAIPERILLCRPSGEIVLANRLAEALLGWSSAEIEGQLVDSILPESVHRIEGAPVLQHLVGRGDGKAHRGAILHRRGVQIEVDLAAAPFPGGYVLLLLRQVPERALHGPAAIEQSIRSETYRLVFEDAPVGIFHFDARGVITECNDPFVRIIGSSKRVLVGLDMTTLPFPPMVAALREALGGTLGRYEGAYPSATSNKITQVRVEFAPITSERGRTVGGVGIAEDITDRVRAEQALRRSFESIRMLVESAPDAIAVHRGDKFLLVNPSLVKMLGYDSADELLATPLLSTIHPEARQVSLLRREEMARGELVPSREYRLMRKDGTWLVAELASLRVHYEDEPAVLTFARDVTERRRMETTLAQAERMVSIGTLAAGVAHEINNPLAYVMGNLELLSRDLSARKDGGEEDEDWDVLLQMVKDARDGCARVRSIVQDLRTFSRTENEAPSPVDVRAVVETAVKMAHVESRHRARLLRAFEDVPRVLGDSNRLAQVVLNLLLNASQAIPPGEPERHFIRVGTHLRGGMVEIAVEDDGEGIDPDTLGRIFEPFYTTKPVGVGTGLGLSICRGIVQAHGGTIHVESALGKGSTFRVLLPPVKPGPSPRAPPDEAPVSGQRARILIIDDEVRLAAALRAVLSHHDVILASSGREGLQRLLSGTPVDLILCDVMMPDVSGVGVYEALRRDRPELCDRFVFMSGGVFPEASVGFIAGPTARRLYKPFDAADVERMLAEVRAAKAR